LNLASRFNGWNATQKAVRRVATFEGGLFIVDFGRVATFEFSQPFQRLERHPKTVRRVATFEGGSQSHSRVATRRESHALLPAIEMAG
jgi:hypothetical protein